MKKIIALVHFCLFCFVTVYAQSMPDGSVLKEEIKKLSFIVGEWKGEGWMLGRDGEKHNFTQTEKVQFKLDSTAILIEGLGKSGEEVIHNALAVLRFDPGENSYSFNSYLSTGLGGSFKGELIGDVFYWYPNENMRYIIKLNEQGKWFETGEINRNGSWFQFFEMTLYKI